MEREVPCTKCPKKPCKQCGSNLIRKTQKLFCSPRCSILYYSARKDISGRNNPNWREKSRGGYSQVHEWIRRRIAKPELCTKCNLKKAIDIHNIDGKYSSDLSSWEWLCRTCHMEVDGRINKLTNGERNKNGWFI